MGKSCRSDSACAYCAGGYCAASATCGFDPKRMQEVDLVVVEEARIAIVSLLELVVTLPGDKTAVAVFDLQRWLMWHAVEKRRVFRKEYLERIQKLSLWGHKAEFITEGSTH